jgi:hypothetical protein
VGRKTHQDTVEKRGLLPFLGIEPRSFGCPARSLVNVLTTLNFSCVVCCFCSYVHAVLVALSLEVKRPGCEANQSPISVEVENEWRYTSTPPICLHGLRRDNSNFTFIVFSAALLLMLEIRGMFYFCF